MSSDFWYGLLTHAAWALIGGGSAHGWSWFQQVLRNSGQRAVFSGLDEDGIETLFVYPPRWGDKPTVLPQTYIEDFMAVNNIISAFPAFGGTPPRRMKDMTKLVSKDKENCNLVLICSSKSNEITRFAIEELSKNLEISDRVPVFENDPHDPSRLRIALNRTYFESGAHGKEGKGDEAFMDHALIIKARSPWNHKRSILIVAGIRGIGTWGAAETLKKWWRLLYDKKPRAFWRGKNSDFAAVVQIDYDNHDIKKATVKYFESL